MSRAAQDVANLVSHQLLHAIASGSQILAGIKFLGTLGKDFADSGGHGQTQVRVDIDLGAAGATSHFDVGFGDAGGIFTHLAAVFVDLADNIFGHAGGTVQHQ